MGFHVALTLMASLGNRSREIKVLRSDTVCEIGRRGREIRGWPTGTDGAAAVGGTSAAGATLLLREAFSGSNYWELEAHELSLVREVVYLAYSS